MLRNLPEGVTYKHAADKDEEAKKGDKSSKEAKNPDIVQCGDFIFDVEVVSKASII